MIFSVYHPSSSVIRGSRPGRIPQQIPICLTRHTPVRLCVGLRGIWEKKNLQRDLIASSHSFPHPASPPPFLPPQYILPPALPFHITHLGELAQGSPPPCNPTYAHPPHSLFFSGNTKINAQFSPSRAEIRCWKELPGNKDNLSSSKHLDEIYTFKSPHSAHELRIFNITIFQNVKGKEFFPFATSLKSVLHTVTCTPRYMFPLIKHTVVCRRTRVTTGAPEWEKTLLN